MPKVENNYEIIQECGSGYCVYCFKHNQPYLFDKDTFRCIVTHEDSGDVFKTAECCNCLNIIVYPISHFTGWTEQKKYSFLKLKSFDIKE